ncbi:MAG: hypothetical protein HY235_26210 [Acidobacteria bacterium]|nr:hypothetical protein [Acidobacteriota bacterium]
MRDRKTPVARLVPPSATAGLSEEILELAAQGLLRLPETKLDLRAFLALPAPRVAREKVSAAIEAEREEG